MFHSTKFMLVAAVCVLGAASEASADFIHAGASATYTEAVTPDLEGDVFTITNLAPLDSGLRISSITITLNDDLLFDTANGTSPNRSSDFAFLVGDGTLIFDGDDSQTLTLDFTNTNFNFAPGQTISFAIDVDNISGLLPDQRQVTGAEFAGSLFSVTFEGGGMLSGAFQESSRLSARADLSGEVEVIPNPEPSALMLLSVGLVTMACVGYVRKRKSTVQAG